MNQNPLSKGMLQVNSSEVGEISSSMVAKRAEELALIAGRPVTTEYIEQAILELTGGDDEEKALLESIPDDDQWDSIPGSSGHQAQESAREDEDEDGLSLGAQLVEEGVNEATHDQMLHAALAEQDNRASD